MSTKIIIYYLKSKTIKSSQKITYYTEDVLHNIYYNNYADFS